jgi:hypothetical protein
MHFHVPKPLHGWREFTGEVGIIVVGVLIALAAEQVVEQFSWRERVHQAEASMSKELSEDDGPQAYERYAMDPCIVRELDRTEQALIAERDRHVPFAPPALLPPPSRSWDQNAWQAASSSGATSHMSAERMYLWSGPYALTPDMNQGALRESQDWAEIERIDTVSIHPSDAERERIMGALARARQDNAFLRFMSGVFLRSSEKAGVHVPASLQRDAASQLPTQLTHCAASSHAE